MNCLQVLTCCTLAVTTLLAAAPNPPKLRLAEAQDIAPVSYRANLSLDPNKDSFDGSIRIQIDVRKPVSVVWLNANQLDVKTATVSSGGRQIAAKPLATGEFLALQLEAELPAGKALLDIGYSGKVRQKDSSGVFRTEDGGNRYILTQFEATDARDAFPCFDEPSYKTPWQLTLRVPAGNQALSNTPGSQTTENGTTTYVFGETRPLPSYLIAFGVGPFEFVDAGHAGKNRVPVRIVTPKGRAAEAKYAASVTAAILTRLEDYFGIPFPYEKSDQVAVPVSAGFGAMENAGMVTYGQTIILAKPDRDTIGRQRNYATIAAHELAHQWFGDLVTTEWWNDVWLNEAFATWMEQKLIREWKPEWKSEMDDVNAKLTALRADSLMSARQIRQPIETKDDVQNAFDAITYEKGAAVIAMFERWIGAEPFRRGVRAYLTRYADKTATSGAFLDEISATGKADVAKSFSTFLNQAGIPEIAVALDCGGKTPVAHLEQSRFVPVGSKGSAKETWRIPVCASYGLGGRRASACMLMTESKMDLPLDKLGSCPAWVNLNEQAKGYYLPNYKGGLLDALTSEEGVRNESPAERVDLMGGAESMIKAGQLSAADGLRLAERFHADPERDVVQRSLGLAIAPALTLVSEKLTPNYERFLQKNFGARARELGWTPRAGESDDVRLLRPTLLGAMATTGADRVLAADARKLAEEWIEKRDAVNPDVVAAVLSTAGYYGDLPLMQRFLAAFEGTRDAQERQRLMGGMLSFRDPKAIEAGMRTVLSGKIPLADGFPLIVGAGQRSTATRKLPFEFVKAHFDEIMRGNPSIFGFDFGGFLPRVGQSFCDERSRDELQSFFGPIAEKYTGARRTLAQTVETINVCVAGKAVQQPNVTEFLAKQ